MAQCVLTRLKIYTAIGKESLSPFWREAGTRFSWMRTYTYDAAGIPDRQHAVRNVLHNDAAAANDHIAADGDTWHDLHACADPDVVADRDGTGVLQPLIAPFRVKRMTSRIEPAVRRDKNVVAKGHLCTVKDNRIVVGKEVFTDGNIAAVIAPERCKDRKTLANRAE